MQRHITYGMLSVITFLICEDRSMTELVVRRLLIDLETPFARHWNGGDAFRTAFFNALSMSFPRGEQFFIDSVRSGWKSLPEAERARLITEYEDTLANPYVAAERGYVDRVIAPSETRTMIVRALRTLRGKRVSLPPKKHGNIPL